MKNKKIITLVLTVLCTTCFAPRVFAQTLLVPSEYNTIDDAIDEAEDGDVVIVSSGTYNETLDIRKNIELRSEGGAAETIIDGGGDGTVVLIANTKISSTGVPKISGFTIRNGKGPEGRGGGITLSNSDAIIEDNIITSNSVDVDGGGILAHLDSDATIRNNTISSNSAKRFGGGIYVVTNSDPLIYNNEITSNTTTGPTFAGGLGGAGGGGIYVDDNSSPQIIKNTITSNSADHAGGGIALRVDSQSIVEENTISNNNAAYGGGVHIETGGSSLRIINNSISNNQANESGTFSGSGFGGGVAVFDNSKPQIIGNSISSNFATQGGAGVVVSESANATITSNKIFENSTSTSSSNYEGGGIYVANASVTINNNLIYKNEAGKGGGVTLQTNATATIENNTIVKNITSSTPSGGGLYIRETISSGVLKNNIITQNQDYQILEDNKKANISYNLINNDNEGIYFSYVAGGFSDIDNLNSDSGVDATGNVSGSEDFVDSAGDDYSLEQTSSAVNIITNTLISDYDIDYNLRSFGGNSDIGAYEYTTETQKTSPVFRFWSDVNSKHFYTIESGERDTVFGTYNVRTWKYEGQVFRAYKLANCSGKDPVYRFWSDEKQGHFYTISESEKNHVTETYSENVWKLEGQVLCAEKVENSFNSPLHRFWGDSSQSHFYTASTAEKNYVVDTYDENVWRYEGVGYYVYP